MSSGTKASKAQNALNGLAFFLLMIIIGKLSAADNISNRNGHGR
jgi:hypothetical protein